MEACCDPLRQVPKGLPVSHRSRGNRHLLALKLNESRPYLNLHDLDRALLLDILAAWRAGSVGGIPERMIACVPDQVRIPPDLLTQNECLTNFVLRALEAALKQPDLRNRIGTETEFSTLAPEGDGLPHTMDRGPDQSVLIALNWAGSPDDVICLAHEVAHAVQIIFSDHNQMQPLAREVCAFLGELLVIAHARTAAPDLYPALCDVWHRENDAYLGSDIDLLAAALADPKAHYQYRQNYPVARLAAVELFNRGSGEWLRQLFASGRDGMRLVPIDELANRAGNIANYLPAMPQPEPETPAIDAYRSLGAMALIDIDYWEGQSETRIKDYYADLLHHLQDQTAFVALNEQRKPIGYATWSKSALGDGYALTRQAAPFGDHRALQSALERYLRKTAGVTVRHTRSATQEQAAW